MANDIRTDGSAMPLKHASARGEVTRNSGNFTRGSQLLSHEILMWLAGAKKPLIVWAVCLALTYFIILSITLSENNFQLICMRVLAGLWDWCGFDLMKRVHLLMPDNSVRQTAMGYVPYVPEVMAACARAKRALIGSFLLATFVAVPLSIWYVGYAKRRGSEILDEHHERGAMLVDRDILYRAVASHNRKSFIADAARFFPGYDPDAVLKMPFDARKAAGIHHPYKLAGIPYPHRLEQSHTMLIGTTGAGKTTALRALIAQMRERQDTAVIFDLTGAYVEAFYDPARDTILNPFDARCPAWSIFNDCTSYSDFVAAASALIPSDGGATDPFWAMAARTLFVEMCMKLIEHGQTSNAALAENLMTADLKKVHAYLAKTIADPLTAPEAARMAESIRAVFNTNAQVLRFLPDTGRKFSIREWITGEKQPGSILFITSQYTDLEMNRALLTLWTNLSIHALMTMPRSHALRTWFMFDELGALHRLPAIEQGLQTARNFGGAMILGLHSFEKLVQIYGQENARNLSSLARNKLILAAADLDTAEQCSRYIGNREVRQMDEAYSYGHNSTRDASTLTPRKQVEPLVIPDDITNLPSMHGFLKYPDGFPAARVVLEWQHYPKVAEGFITRRPPVAGGAKRGSEGEAPVGGGSEGGGRDGAAQAPAARAEAAIEPGSAAANIANLQAANILSAPSENQQAANDQVTPAETPSKADTSASEPPRDLPIQPIAAPVAAPPSDVARSNGLDGVVGVTTTAPAPVEDQALIELRQATAERGDDGLGMGD